MGRVSVIRNTTCLPRTPVSNVPFSAAQDQSSAGTGALPGSGLCLATVCMPVCSIVPDSLQPHGLQPTRLHWSGLPFPTQGIFPNQGSNLPLFGRWILYH